MGIEAMTKSAGEGMRVLSLEETDAAAGGWIALGNRHFCSGPASAFSDERTKR